MNVAFTAAGRCMQVLTYTPSKVCCAAGVCHGAMLADCIDLQDDYWLFPLVFTCARCALAYRRSRCFT